MLNTGYWMNYRDLEVWQVAREAVIAIHEMTLTKLPKFEAFEEASQIGFGQAIVPCRQIGEVEFACAVGKRRRRSRA